MNEKTKLAYEFGGFRVDIEQQCLWHRGDLISITPKAFETLAVLIEYRGRIVEKDLLMERVWDDTFVEESSLAQNISKLRKVFTSLDGGHQYIETIPRRGYRFVGDVSEVFGESELLIFERQTKTNIVTEEEILDHNTSTNSQAGVARNNGAQLTSGRLQPLFKTRTRLLISAACGISLFAGVYGIYSYLAGSAPMSQQKFRDYQMTRLISNGDILRTALSPDGNYIGLVEKKGDLQSLLLRQSTGAKTLEIVSKISGDIVGLTFSPDSQNIFYTVYLHDELRDNHFVGKLFRVPILGGLADEIATDVDSAVAISPQGDRVAFVRFVPGSRESQLIVADVTTRQQTILTRRTDRQSFASFGPAWSPDGKYLSIGAQSAALSGFMDLVAVSAASGEQTTLMSAQAKAIQQTTWLKDSSGIVMTATSDTTPNITDEIWLVSFPDGTARQISNGVSCLFGISMTADSNSLVTVQTNRTSSFWVFPVDKLNAGNRIADLDQGTLISKDIGDYSLGKLGMDWSNDGKLTYAAVKGGSADVYIVDGDGSNPLQLTTDKNADYNPVMSPDQSFIIFLSNRSGSFNIWRMQRDGTNQKKLTDFMSVSYPSISVDGKWVYFEARSYDKPGQFLWKIPSEGGDAVQITKMETRMSKISPDGSLIAAYVMEKSADGAFKGRPKLSILSPDNGNVIKQFEAPASYRNESAPQWTPDGKGITYIVTENGVSDIWLQPIDAATPRKLFSSQTDEIFRYAWSRDGSKLALEKGLIINDVLLFSDVVR